MDNKRSCGHPRASLILAKYCFGDAKAEDRAEFELHLQTCEFCRQEVERLSLAVKTLRTDTRLRTAVTDADIASLVGISARFDLLFFGHLAHVLISSALQAVNFVFILFIEIAYGFDQYGAGGFKVAPVLFVAVFCLSMATLAVDERLIRRGHSSAVWASLVSLCGSGLVYLGVCTFIPDHAIIHVKVTAYSAQVSYLKDVLYLLPISILFFLRPFHFVGAMQAQLSKGRHRPALALLTNRKRGLSPRGLAFPSVNVLIGFIVVAFFYLIPATFRLFDMLLPGPYTSLFSKLILFRWVFYFATIAECLWWYRNSLEELKRECMVMIHEPGQGEP